MFLIAMDNMPSLADSESMVIGGEVAPQDVELVQVMAAAGPSSAQPILQGETAIDDPFL
jgi:hypothetical protein